MINYKRVFTAAAADVDGFAASATGATWALAGTTPGDGLAHFVTIENETATDHSAKTIVLTGYDANGHLQTETLAAPGTSATVTSLKAYKDLIAAVPSATIGADTVNIGWTEACRGPWVGVLSANPTSVAVGVAGTANIDVQHTYDAVLEDGSLVFGQSALIGKTASVDSSFAHPITGLRLDVNSHTSGVFTLHILQA